MKKIIIFFGIFFAIFLMIVPITCMASVVEWKIGVVTPPGHPHTLGAEYLAKLIEERSDGQLLVRVYHSGELGSNPELMDNVKQGIIALTVNTPGVMAEYHSITGLLELPYIFTSLEHRAEIIDGEIGQHIAEVYLENTGMRILGYFGGAQRNMITTSKAIQSISDLRGLKMRTWEWDVMLKWWESLGAIPAIVSFPEVYTAFQTGLIDGAENEFTTFDVSKWAEVCSYIAITQHNFTVRPLVVNENALSRLPEDLREIVIQAGKDASVYAEDLEIALDVENMEMLQDEYNIEYTYPDVEPFIERSIPIIREYAIDHGISDLAEQIIELGM